MLALEESRRYDPGGKALSNMKHSYDTVMVLAFKDSAVVRIALHKQGLWVIL
jgi:hypothetical protein